MKKHAKMFLSLAASGLSSGLLCGAEGEVKGADLPPQASATVAQAEPFFRGIDLLMPVTFSAEYRLPTDIKGGTGRMRSWSAGTEVALRHIAGENIFYGSLGYSYTDYHFSGMATAPFNDTERVRAYVRFERGKSEQWGWFVDATGGFAAEKAANMSDGAFGRFGGGVRYTVSPDLNIYLGAQVMTRMADSATIFPFIGLEWRVDEHWSVHASNGLVVSYDVLSDQSLRVDLGCMYNSSNFRLEENGERKPALEIQEVPLVLSVTQELGRHGYVRGSVAGILYSKYKGRSGGNAIGELKADPTVAFGLEAGVRF